MNGGEILSSRRANEEQKSQSSDTNEDRTSDQGSHEDLISDQDREKINTALRYDWQVANVKEESEQPEAGAYACQIPRRRRRQNGLPSAAPTAHTRRVASSSSHEEGPSLTRQGSLERKIRRRHSFPSAAVRLELAENNASQPSMNTEPAGLTHDNSRHSEIIVNGRPNIQPNMSNRLVPTAAVAESDEGDEEQRLRDAQEQGRQSVPLNAVNAEVVAPQIFTSATIRMPRFPFANELRFKAEHNHLLLSALRIFRPVAMALNLTFFLWDVLQPEAPLLACAGVIVVTLLLFYEITRFADTSPGNRPCARLCSSFPLSCR